MSSLVFPAGIPQTVAETQELSETQTPHIILGKVISERESTDFPKISLSYVQSAGADPNLIFPAPLVHKNFAICMQGKIENPELIPLAPAFAKRAPNNTDAERLFQYIIQLTAGLKTPQSIRRAIVKAMMHVRTQSKYTVANIVFSNGRFLWGIREINQSNPLVKIQKLFGRFSMFYGTDADLKTKLIASQNILMPGIRWEKLANHSLLEIDTKTGRVQTMKF